MRPREERHRLKVCRRPQEQPFNAPHLCQHAVLLVKVQRGNQAGWPHPNAVAVVAALLCPARPKLFFWASAFFTGPPRVLAVEPVKDSPIHPLKILHDPWSKGLWFARILEDHVLEVLRRASSSPRRQTLDEATHVGPCPSHGRGVVVKLPFVVLPYG